MLRQTLNKNLKCISSIGMALFIATTLLVVMTGSAGATPLPVNSVNFNNCPVNTSGCLNGSGLSVQVIANTCINFYNGNNPDPGFPGSCDSLANNTYFNSGPSATSIFTLNTFTGTIKDLSFGTPPPINSFMTAPGPLGSVTFDLTSVPLSAQPPCAPNQSSGSCSAGVFTLTQQDNNQSLGCPAGYATCGHVGVLFAFNALACTNGSTVTGCGLSGGSTPYTINFSSQFNAETIGDLIAKASSAGSPTTAAGIFNSVSFTANPQAVPEPAGFVLIGAGLIGISLIARRRVQSKA